MVPPAPRPSPAAPGQAATVREEAASAVRRLVNALAAHEADEAELLDLARAVDSLAADLEANERRARTVDPVLLAAPTADGDELRCSPDCMVAGSAHPSSLGLVGHRHGEEAVLTTTLGPAHEGLPGRVHGGMVASLFDEAMGFAMWMEEAPGFTAWLRVEYRAPMPTDVPVEIRARVTDRERRKRLLRAEATAGGEVVAEAEGLFVIPSEALQGADGRP